MGDPVTVRLREDIRNPGHVHLSVFVGRHDGSRGHSGQLVLRTDEWDELRAKIVNGDPCDILEVADD